MCYLIISPSEHGAEVVVAITCEYAVVQRAVAQCAIAQCAIAQRASQRAKAKSLGLRFLKNYANSDFPGKYTILCENIQHQQPPTNNNQRQE